MPRFVRGHAVSLAMVAMGCIVYTGLWWWYANENRRRKASLESEKESGLTDEDTIELGDDSPRFIFIA